ncbi:Zinc finger, DNA-directed DNA polymerase, family B, alpha [Dillenia turbinata]|uniref:DNA-directed DNA polymerase n=1 Tax=Dillenia turbinata TaxID=194707 RepID=A0AAN8UVX8_9MAGN
MLLYGGENLKKKQQRHPQSLDLNLHKRVVLSIQGTSSSSKSVSSTNPRLKALSNWIVECPNRKAFAIVENEALEDKPNHSESEDEVALRLKQSGYTTGCSAGDTVPYVASAGSSTGIAQRARHPDELKRDHGKWMIDIDYYLSQQIHPVVSRLCASIQGTGPSRLADCLGLDSSKFQKSSEAVGNDLPVGSCQSRTMRKVFGALLYISLSFSVTSIFPYGCLSSWMEPWLSCPSCSWYLSAHLCLVSIHPSQMKSQRHYNRGFHLQFLAKIRCPKCPDEGDGCKLSPASIANQVKRQVDGFISLYYKASMTCDDESCNHTTRSINLRVIGDSERGTVCPNYPCCSGRLVRKMEISTRIQLETKLARIRPAVDLAASIVRKLRDQCSWVKLSDLVV